VERAATVHPAGIRRAFALPRVAGWQALSLVIVASAVVRSAAAFARQTPMYFPDEYLYTELGRSIATVGRPLVRGQHASFPGLLQPLVTAPAWLLGDVADAYHAIQLMNAVAMSLAAVPVYLLARRVGVTEHLAVAAAALALVLPDLVYSGWVLSEPFAYPLALLAAWLGVRALDRPTAGAQLAFLGAAGLAGLARSQLLVLPICFLVAALVMDVRERQLLWTVRRQWVVVGAAVLAAAAFAAHGSVGQYGDVLSGLDLGPASLVHRLGTQGLALLYGAGLVVVPGAALGLAAAFARPRTRAELALAAFTVPFTGALLLQASLWGDTGQMQERYLFYAVPLLAVGFALHAGRGWPWWRAYALLCAGLLLLAATTPLSGYAVALGKDHAAVLFAVTRAEEAFGGVAGGSLVWALAAGAVAVLAALLARTRRATVAVTALALAAPAAAAFAATSYDLRYDASVRNDYLPADRSWVDHAAAGDVALVYSKGIPKEGLEQLFWNRSVRRILLLPGAPPLDAYGADKLSIAPDGTLLDAGRPLDQPLLVDGGAAVITLRGARRVAASQTYELWTPAGKPRLSYYATGWYRDGWLGTGGAFRLWGRHIAGRIRFTVSRAAGDEPATLSLRTPAGRMRITVRPGETRTVSLTACGTAHWKATFGVDRLVLFGSRLLGMRATEPVWTPDRGACR
jgi:hypothetical protein